MSELAITIAVVVLLVLFTAGYVFGCSPATFLAIALAFVFLYRTELLT